MAEITTIDVASLLVGDFKYVERTIVLTERESLRLLERLENPSQPEEHLLKAKARYREMLREQEPYIDHDPLARLNRQCGILRIGQFNEVQAQRLLTHFLEQVRRQQGDLCTLLRHIFIDRGRLEVDSLDQFVIEQLVGFRDRAANQLHDAPLLRKAVTPCLAILWQQAHGSLKCHLAEPPLTALPEQRPYTLDEILGDTVWSAAVQITENRSEYAGGAGGDFASSVK